MLVNLSLGFRDLRIEQVHLLLDQGFARFEFRASEKLLLQRILGFFNLVFELPALLFLVDLVQVSVI